MTSKAYDLNLFVRKELLPSRILFTQTFMDRSIYFYRQLRFWAVKVEDEAIYRMLTPKFVSDNVSVPEQMP